MVDRIPNFRPNKVTGAVFGLVIFAALLVECFQRDKR